MPDTPKLEWHRQEDGSWTAARGRFRAARLSGSRWALEDSERGTGSVLERTAGVYGTLRDARMAAQRLLEQAPARQPRRR